LIDYKLPKMLSQASQNTSTEKATTAHFISEVALVSVIIPCYNHARYLGQAIESVLDQSYPRVEIIVVDDGSTDHTTQVAARYSGVHYVRQENQGLSAARNTGLRQSRGDFPVFLDADDLLLPGALEAGLNCLKTQPEAAFVSGHYRYIQEDGSFLSQYPQEVIEDD
jgi:glycosyltransferase involved in cell wall biosynthesis